MPVEVSLPSLGFDSLMAVEIKNRIETDLQVEIPMVKLLEGQSINQLSDFLSKKLAASTFVKIDGQGPAANDSSSSSQGEEDWEEGTL